MEEPKDSPNDGVGVAGKHYGRRWLAYAFSASRDWFGLHVGVLVATILGPGVGYFLFAYITAGSTGIDPAANATRWLLFGSAGTLLLFLAAFLAQLAMSPAALERREAAAAHERQILVEKDLAEARATIKQQLAESDASRLHEIEVVLEGGELQAVDITSQAHSDWFDAAKLRYVEGYSTAIAQDKARRSDAYAGALGDYLRNDLRNGDQFVEELRAYFEAVTERWIAALRAAAIDHRLAQLRLAVRNTWDVSVEGVEVQITFPPDVGAGWEDDAEMDDELPEPPLMWGEKTMYAVLPGIRPLSNRTPDPGRIERVSGLLTVTWDRFDLSGLSRHPLAPLNLFVPGDHAGNSLTIKWKAASLKRRGILSGELAVPIGSVPVAPAAVLQRQDG